MTCYGSFAEPWEFTAFWCISALLLGSDDSGGAGNAFLTDSQINMQEFGFRANEGMLLWNLTQGTSGPITNIGLHTLTANGVSWDDGDEYRAIAMTQKESSAAEHALMVTASDLHLALAAANACDCTLATWAYDPTHVTIGYLTKLNIIDAAVFHQCPCAKSSLTDDMKQAYLDWMNEQLQTIREGEVELCEGETGGNFPATAFAEYTWTSFSLRQIVENDLLRNLT